MISLIVFRKRYFCLGSDFVTRANTLSRKNLGLPIVILPSEIEAACLTSSVVLEKYFWIKLKVSASLDKSTSFPYSPRQSAPVICFLGVLSFANYMNVCLRAECVGSPTTTIAKQRADCWDLRETKSSNLVTESFPTTFCFDAYLKNAWSWSRHEPWIRSEVVACTAAETTWVWLRAAGAVMTKLVATFRARVALWRSDSEIIGAIWFWICSTFDVNWVEYLRVKASRHSKVFNCNYRWDLFKRSSSDGKCAYRPLSWTT